ncbi:SRPBCC family protein [Embleya sp. NPDC001921]
MRFTGSVPVAAAPDAVFALINDVERVATCMPGAVLEGRDGDEWRGGVKVKVGPVTAAYAGTVRFLEVDAANRRLRVQARGVDTHGSGDAEAEVTVAVVDAPGGGARLELSTDLVIRGKIAQFGKGAITAVSDRILQQFAGNLGGLLEVATAPARNGSAPPQATTARTAAPPPAGPHTSPPAAFQPVAGPELDGLAVVAGPVLAKYGPLVGAFAFGLFEGWLLGRLVTVERRLRATRGAGS